jgi:hypothetical protein
MPGTILLLYMEPFAVEIQDLTTRFKDQGPINFVRRMPTTARELQDDCEKHQPLVAIVRGNLPFKPDAETRKQFQILAFTYDRGRKLDLYRHPGEDRRHIGQPTRRVA